MKRFIIITLGIIALVTLVLVSKPAKAEVKGLYTHPEYDEATMHCAAEDIWDLFYQLQNCPAMMEEVEGNPLLVELYTCADRHDCINCAAVLMFKLWQSSDVWADTLGESEHADYLVEDVVYLLHEQTLLDEYLLQQKEEEV